MHSMFHLRPKSARFKTRFSYVYKQVSTWTQYKTWPGVKKEYDILLTHKDWTFTGSKIKNDRGKIIQNWPPKQLMATWDDHDYGLDDQGFSFQYKNIGKVFCLEGSTSTLSTSQKFFRISFFLCSFDREVLNIFEIN